MPGGPPSDASTPSTRPTETQPQLERAPTEGIPSSVGPYQIIREIGHGGMGTVYLASRTGDLRFRRVALKVVRGIHDAEMLRHLRRETKILASLNHPHIARLLDGGTTDEGVPFLAMEYVDGQSINVYCDRRSLTVRERLVLFLDVCRAVQHAHSNLIVHRDLKPQNILVTPEGTVKLLDFGIAKLLNPELLTDGVTSTVAAFTPEYASPEQARGDTITTASDVYSLGVVLYELLTGHRPHGGRVPLEVLRAVAEDEAEPPSSVVTRAVETRTTHPTADATTEAIGRCRGVTPERLRRLLRGDLDNILLMLLRKEPQRRYSSVEALAEDISGYLNGLPVSARGGTLAYRAGKFLKRHAAVASLAGALAVIVVGTAVAMTIQAARVTRALETAEHQRRNAEKVSAFLVDLFKLSDPSESRGNTVTAREVLDAGASRISGELADQPETRATLMNVMGNVYSSLGLYEKALPLQLDALATRKRIWGDRHLEVALSLSDMGETLLGRGEYPRAAAAHREALAIRRQLLNPRHPDVATSLSNLANALYRSHGDQKETEALYRQALSIREAAFGAQSAEVAESMSNLANVRRLQGAIAEAEALHRSALDIRRQIFGEFHPAVAFSLNNLAMPIYDRGDVAAAESLLRESLRVRRKVFGENHPELATGLSNLAVTLCEQGKYVEAEPLLREAASIQRLRLGGRHIQLALSIGALADAVAGQKRWAEAEPLYREALATFELVVPADHPARTDALLGLGSLLAAKGLYRDAEPFLRGALATRQALYPPGHGDTAVAEGALGSCLAALGRYEEAEKLLQHSYSTLQARQGEGSRRTREARGRLASLYERMRLPAKAALYRGLASQP